MPSSCATSESRFALSCSYLKRWKSLSCAFAWSAAIFLPHFVSLNFATNSWAAFATASGAAARSICATKSVNLRRWIGIVWRGASVSRISTRTRLSSTISTMTQSLSTKFPKLMTARRPTYELCVWHLPKRLGQNRHFFL